MVESIVDKISIMCKKNSFGSNINEYTYSNVQHTDFKDKLGQYIKDIVKIIGYKPLFDEIQSKLKNEREYLINGNQQSSYCLKQLLNYYTTDINMIGILNNLDLDLHLFYEKFMDTITQPQIFNSFRFLIHRVVNSKNFDKYIDADLGEIMQYYDYTLQYEFTTQNMISDSVNFEKNLLTIILDNKLKHGMDIDKLHHMVIKLIDYIYY